MSMTSRRNGTGRLYVRRFDHEEALERWAAGERVTDLAAEYDVTRGAIYQLRRTNAQVNEAARRFRAGTCEHCGGPAMRLVGAKRSHNPDARVLCIACRGLERRKPLLHAPDGTPLLECGTCGEAKPLVAHLPRVRRRLAEGKAVGRTRCRACETQARRDYRNAHRQPCVSCGAPALPPSEKGARGFTEPRCRACYVESLRTRTEAVA